MPFFEEEKVDLSGGVIETRKVVRAGSFSGRPTPSENEDPPEMLACPFTGRSSVGPVNRSSVS